MDKYSPYEHQVAGRHSEFCSQLLRGEYGRLLKPYKLTPNTPSTAPSILKTRPHTPTGGNKDTTIKENYENGNHGPACANEKAFYELCYSSSELAQLRSLIPQYYGEMTVTINDKLTPHLVLEDLTAGFRYPCVADVKMGTEAVYPGKNMDKVLNDKKKYMCRQEFGWCVTGMKLFRPTGQLTTDFGPVTGRALSTLDTKRHLEAFVTASGLDRLEPLNQILHEVEQIHRWFETQKTFWFRTSSILLLYDADYFKWKQLEACDAGKGIGDGLTDHENVPGPSEKSQIDLVRQPNELKRNYDSSKPPTDRDVATKESCQLDVLAESAASLPKILRLECASSSGASMQGRISLKKTNVESTEPKGPPDTPAIQRLKLHSNVDSVQHSSRTNYPNVRVKMIDFAHILHADNELDSSYITGLENLIRFLKECQTK